jgi:hypothetical protein
MIKRKKTRVATILEHRLQQQQQQQQQKRLFALYG